MASSEEEYIRQRKKKAIRLSLKFLLMRVFPIRKRKIVFSAFEGDGGFCCNPRYIAEELHRRNHNYEMIWLVHNTSREFPGYIRAVRDTSWNLAYHLSTAHIWIDNYRKPYGTLKRSGQIYIQTWHASIGFKAVGLFRGKEFPKIAKIVSTWDSNLVNYMISNSDYCDRVYPKKLLYNGPTFRSGSPRVDCLINCKTEIHRMIRDKYGIDQKVKILLFAPTFRGGVQAGKKEVFADMPSVDFERLMTALSEKFGGEWRIFLRLHPQLSAKMEKMPLLRKTTGLIDVSQEPDMSEIMAACDGVLTDYSSCAFDACFAGIPVFLYTDDIGEYVKNRGNLMWKKEELPFSMAETNQELLENIRKFDYDSYLEAVKKFMTINGVEENGDASSRVADLIESYM